jgi:peptidoglycan/xylan/chitin deacetylase (PgdA/CDA1 family)
MKFVFNAKLASLRLLRESFFSLTYLLFGYIPYSVVKERGLRILIYHGVVKNKPYKFNSRILAERQFERHLQLIKKCFNVLTFEDFKSKNLRYNKLNVMLTFDDGLKNNLRMALPLLVKYNVPAVFFITASANRNHYLFNDIVDVFSFTGPKKIEINGVGFIKTRGRRHFRHNNNENRSLAQYFHDSNTKAREAIIEQIYSLTSKQEFAAYSDYIDLMSDNEIETLNSSASAVIASHGMSHSDFAVLSSEQLYGELVESKKILEGITGRECEAIAFPYGNYNALTLTLCKEAGYKYIFGTEKINAEQDKTDVIARFTINPYVSAINQMYYIAKNRYD